MMPHPTPAEKTVIWPVIILSWILPLFLFVSAEKPTASESHVYYYAYDSDYFYHGKSLLFGIFVMILILALIRRGYGQQLWNSMMTATSAPLVFMGAMVLLSVVFSNDMQLALRGGLRHFEGVGVMLGYLALPLLITLRLNKATGLRIMVWSCLPVAAVGISQYLGFNLLNTQLVKTMLFLNADMALRTPDIIPLTGGVGATLGNSNFAGSYCALMVPLALGYALWESEVRLAPYRILPYIFSVFLLLASQSSAGLAGAFAAVCVLQFTPVMARASTNRAILLLAMPMLADALMTIWHPSMTLQPATAMGAVIFTVITWLLLAVKAVLLKHHSFQGQFLFIHGLLLGGFVVIVVFLLFIYPGRPLLIDKITASSNMLTVAKGSEVLSFRADGNRITVEAPDASPFIRPLPAAEDFSVHTQEIGVLRVRYAPTPEPARLILPDYRTSFIIRDSRFFVESLLQTVEITSPPRLPALDRLEALGSHRVFIWSRTLPLLPERILIGSGPDSFAVSYPQHDPLGRINNGIDSRLIVDKAHNMYLQYAVNYGIPFVVAFIFLVARMGVRCYRGLSGDARRGASYLLYSAVIGYCTAGIFNDSIPSVAPLFWLVVGMVGNDAT